jgi:hypothetical protein
MTRDRTVAEARLKSLHAEVLRGLSLVALRRAEDVQEGMRATRAEISQRRLHDARCSRVSHWPPRSAAPR